MTYAAVSRDCRGREPPLRARRLLLVAAILLCTGAAAPPQDRATADDLARLRHVRKVERWAEADSLATALLARLEGRASADSLAIAEALFTRADAWLGLGRGDSLALASARTSLAIRRRRLPPLDRAVGETEALVSLLYSSMGAADSSLPHARRALEIELRQPAPNDTTLADDWFNVGQVEIALEHGRPALDALGHALEIETRLYGPADNHIARDKMTMGDAYKALHELERYRDMQEEAIAVLDRSGQRDDALRSQVLARLAESSQDMGDMSRAFDAAQAGVKVADASGDSTNMADSRFNLAIILREFGDDAGAHQVLTELLPFCVRCYGPDHWIVGRLRQTLGATSEALGDTAQAMRLYLQSEADLLAHPEPMGSTVALSVFYEAGLLHRQGRDREALALCRRAARLAEASTIVDPGILPLIRYLRIRIAWSLRDSAALDSTRRDLADVYARLSMGGTRTAPVIAYWLAQADQDLGRDEEAWTGALEAEQQIRERTRFNVETLPDSRALELMRTRTYILSQVLDMAGPEHPARWETAWDRLVRTRGLVRAEIQRRRLPAGMRADTTVVRLRDAWVAAQARLARRMVRGLPAPGDAVGAAELDALRSDDDRTEAEYARALRARGADTSRTEIGLGEIRARLGPDRALVGFAEIQGRDEVDRLIAFVAPGGSDRIERLELGRSDSLRAVIAPWRERLATPPGTDQAAARAAERACRRLGQAVRARTWDRIAPYLGKATEVDLVPDGPVADLPWNALPAGRDGYRVERGPLLRCMDAERELVTTPRENGGDAMLAMGDPDFDMGTHAAAAAAPVAGLRAASDPCAAGPPHFPALPGTGTEVGVVAAEWRVAPGHVAEVRRGAEASEAAFKRLAPGCAILHLATHGVVTGDRCRESVTGLRGIGGVAPLDARAKGPARQAATARPAAASSPWLGRRVWLALAGANHARESQREDDDGLLTADEVVTLELSGTDWVVLSACHSGLAESWTDEGALGMRRAFQLAGARSVIASQWALDDQVTVDWMRALYDVRARGETRAAAAVEATCRHVLDARRRARQSTHPFYWAAFSASGN